ncbi:type II toxin-antitoxin system RelE/ParE family toxin [Methylorubrum populi]
MPQIFATEIFDAWLLKLRDRMGRTKILTRIDRLQQGNPGVVRSVGEGVQEMKIDFGPGYLVYFVERADGSIVVLLCGGDKDSQSRDITRAKALARTV